MTPEQRTELKQIHTEARDFAALVDRFERVVRQMDDDMSTAELRIAMLHDVLSVDMTEDLKALSSGQLDGLLGWFAQWTDDVELELKSRAKK